MRPTLLLLLAALSGVAFAPLPATPAVASCAAPYLVGGEPLVLARDAPTTVEGEAFMDGCQDVGSCTVGIGCDSCDYGPEPTPTENVELRLRQHGRTWVLGTADADAEGRTSWTVELPGGVERGGATLLPDGAEPARVRIR